MDYKFKITMGMRIRWLFDRVWLRLTAARIRKEDLPDPDDKDAVLQFAASFNGYTYYGSFAACANEASLKKRDSIVSLRNELFFHYRAGNHQGTAGYIDCYKELLPFFERILA